MDQHKTSKKRKLGYLLNIDESLDSVLFSQQKSALASPNSKNTHKINPWKKVKIDSQILSHVEGGFFSLEELDGHFYEDTPSALLEDLNQTQHVESISISGFSSKNSSTNDSNDQTFQSKQNNLSKKLQFTHQMQQSSSSIQDPEKESNLIEKVISFTITGT
jgi:hypothetical protein